MLNDINSLTDWLSRPMKAVLSTTLRHLTRARAVPTARWIRVTDSGCGLQWVTLSILTCSDARHPLRSGSCSFRSPTSQVLSFLVTCRVSAFVFYFFLFVGVNHFLLCSGERTMWVWHSTRVTACKYSVHLYCGRVWTRISRHSW